MKRRNSRQSNEEQQLPSAPVLVFARKVAEYGPADHEKKKINFDAERCESFQFTVWDVNAIETLRREYRIVGTMIGTSSVVMGRNNPQKRPKKKEYSTIQPSSSFSVNAARRAQQALGEKDLPLLLLYEEVCLLLHLGVIVVVDEDKRFGTALNAGLGEKEVKLYLELCKKENTQRREIVERKRKEQREKYFPMQLEKNQKKKQTRMGEEEIANEGKSNEDQGTVCCPANEKSGPLSSQEASVAENLAKSLGEKILWRRVFTVPPPCFTSYKVDLSSMKLAKYFLDAHGESAKAKMVRRRCIVFRDLWERGYYLTPGAKFGGDFLAYEGEPLVYHSQFVVRIKGVNEQEEDNTELQGAIVRDADSGCISGMEIVLYGRLATSVKKQCLLAYVNLKTERVKYSTISWAGI
eukprot:Nk52_evm55s2309 gene=Nk52_evmTU55s2309